MPLSSTGKKIRQNMRQEYGSRGDRVFYAKENSDKKFRRTVRERGRSIHRG